MNKVIISGLGVLFIVAFLISGCGKSEEKKTEAPAAPAASTETVKPEAAPVQEPAAAVEQKTTEAVAPADTTTMEKTGNMVDEAAEEMKQVGEKTVDTAVEKGQDTMEKAKTEAEKAAQ